MDRASPAAAFCASVDGVVLDLSSASPADVRRCSTSTGSLLHFEDEPVRRRPAQGAPMPDFVSDLEPVSSSDELVSTVSVPEPDSVDPSDIAAIVQSTGGGALGIVAALIAVVGGTAGFKLWTKIAEQRHEQRMKQLEIDQANAGLGGAQPPPCQAANQSILSEISSVKSSLSDLQSKMARFEKMSAGFDPSVDLGDLENRVEFIEKSLRKKNRSGGGD